MFILLLKVIEIVMMFAILTANIYGTILTRVDTVDSDTSSSSPIPMTAMSSIDHVTQFNASKDENTTSSIEHFPGNGHVKSGGDCHANEDSQDTTSHDDLVHDNDGNILHSGTATASAVINAAFKLGSVLNATSTIESTYPNWVGTELDNSFSAACWRRAHFARKCPLGYDNKFGICWSQCPYSHPIGCGLECIRQNDNCALAIVTKVAVVVQTSLSLSGWSIYGDMTKWPKGVQLAIKCTKYMISLSKSLIKYIRYIKVYHPEATKDKILAMLYRIDNVIIDIPVSISYCYGKRVSDDIKFADSVVMTTEYALRELINYGGGILSSWTAFAKFMKRITLGDSISSLNETTIRSLKSALKSNSTCGYDMKRLLDRTWMTVAELRRLNPGISENDVRVFMSRSNLMLNDIPIATNNCITEMMKHVDTSTAYVTRSLLRKTFGVIVEDLVKSGTSNNGSFLTVNEYAVRIADRTIAVWAIWDIFYLSSLYSEYFEPICSQPELTGEIDDGHVQMALGMSIVGHAFNNSYGVWTKSGNGSIIITFNSNDVDDVSVYIKSKGYTVDEVAVPAGKTVQWISSVVSMGGKTLYLEHCRRGLMGFPRTGGGSLLLWIPRSSHGGSLQLTAVLNVI